jgi:outer membrane protein TolC
MNIPRTRSAGPELIRGIILCGMTIIASGARMPARANENDAINLPRYLQMVKDANFGAQGSSREKNGAELRKREADLIFAPSLFANGQISSDSSPQDLDVGGMMYNKLSTREYSVGVSQTYNFGLQAKLYYSLEHLHYYFPEQADTAHYDASPVIELTQSLWQNAKGRYDRSKADSTRAQAEGDKWSAENTLRNLLVNAEKAYWSLALSKELVDIREYAVDEGQAILDYEVKRARMNLADQSDMLQAKASLESKKLDLKSAKDSMSSAMRSFLSYINAQPDGADAQIEPVNWNILMHAAEDFKRPGDRADVQQAQADAAQSVAGAQMNEETDKPVLTVSLSQTLHGQDPSLTGVFDDSLNFQKPTTTLGLKFSIPLEYSMQKEARHGAQQIAEAAELTYRQKLKDQESDWTDLVDKLRDARKRLEMAFVIENAQKEKLEYEKKRLKEGRTTTYQILSFEQDFAQSQYDRVSAAATVLELAAQVKLYGELPYPSRNQPNPAQ